MIIKNGLLFKDNGAFHKADIAFSDKIDSIGATISGESTFDAADCYVIPGFIDIHVHGVNGSDFCDASEKDIKNISSYLAQNGVTSFCPTSMAFDEKILSDIFSCLNDYCKKPCTGGSNIAGINMEGPFLARDKRGAHDEKFIQPPDYDMLQRLNAVSGERIKLVDIAPETAGAQEFIKKASRDYVVSLAHTNADYETAMTAYENGATHLTHLFNAMTPINHRNPGVIGAAADKAKFVELICDGIHVSPSVVRMAFNIFSDDRICLISDCIRAGGLKDGDYSLGGQPVKVDNGKATLADGTIAGSATPLHIAVKRAVEFGIDMEKAIKCATHNPAKAIGIFDKTGSLTVGKNADIVVLDKNFKIKAVFIGGKKIK